VEATLKIMSKKVIYCNCKGNIVDTERLEAIHTFVSKLNVPSVKLSDLCSVCATNLEDVKSQFTTSDEVLVIACYPRAVKLLLERAGIKTDAINLSFVNFRESCNEDIFKILQDFGMNDAATSQISKEIEGDSEWPSWYPAIDYDRCTACGQCADFCLFGVYEKTDGKVKVVNPQGCKNNCPACARICPHTAIVFPKYQQGGAIAGAETIDEIAEQQRQRQDMDDILGSDIYQALEQRKAKRRAIIKTEAMNKALEEREKALQERKP